MDEDELLSRCRAGDQQGYADLFYRYKQRALRLAYAITGDYALSDDATQEAFIQAFRALGNIHPGAQFGPWFYAIVANRARKMARRRNWRWLPIGAVEALSDPQAADTLETVEESDVWRAVKRLPLDLRVVVALRYVLDLTESEAAGILHVPVGTVKSRMYRVRKLLKQELCQNRKGAPTLWIPLMK